MSNILYTVQNILDEIRAQLDEQNRDSVSDTNDILPTINRAQDYAFDILANKYPEPILQYATLSLSSGAVEYDIPPNVFEDRVQKIEMRIPSGQAGAASYREVQRISYRDISDYESASKTNIPYYYAIYGRKIRFVPIPTGTYSARMWYLRNPQKLVAPQGRITKCNAASNYLLVDSPGPDLTTESDQLESYVNLIDGQTGDVKGTLQIQSLSDNKITFRTAPTRSSVLDKQIGTSLSGFVDSNQNPITVNPDDYICNVSGTCVPYFGRPVSNFLIQYAVSEIVRKLGGNAMEEEQVLAKFEQQVSRVWTGREQTLRVKKRSQNWGVPTRRLYYE